jgi:LmbE family N-acetylglucosaminyl deacetylase
MPQKTNLPATGLWPHKSALVIVAHPDDETLWAGGTILMHPETAWTVVALCRQSDRDRAPKFFKALDVLGASGRIGDLDDGPRQVPLEQADVRHAVLSLVGDNDSDLILTHSVDGEYTRHRRHEEAGRAVLALWDAGRLHSHELWAFAYGDEDGQTAVNALPGADIFTRLPANIWERKRNVVSQVYGFAPGSFEMRAALPEEAFWKRRSK